MVQWTWSYFFSIGVYLSGIQLVFGNISLLLECLCEVWKSNVFQQECIPVGCVPSAAVAFCWGGGSPAMGVLPGSVFPRGVSA